MAFNYAFPVFYPDWSLESILYIRRFKTNLFFDYGYGIGIAEEQQNGYTPFTGNYCSFGMEITADIHPFRFIFPISTGIRMGYIPGKNEVFTNFLINVSTRL